MKKHLSILLLLAMLTPLFASCGNAEIPDETEVELLKKGDVWCLIRYEGKEGYCLTSLIRLIPPAE